MNAVSGADKRLTEFLEELTYRRARELEKLKAENRLMRATLACAEFHRTHQPARYGDRTWHLHERERRLAA